ncbi:ABC transporter permease subunit [Sinomonas sp. JGH33]|uniref:ABC transporter permease subunit n=1 Tax=Sinomonas terricola TaxID=3110330 RepID=A0ABU5TAR9_9MICC|nr:ABC transporter permease subunit [Sinomonas sp. JGH33]MEA5456784.1 ABC transporter permease subunit [Sinomonas sp. JGH33]
MLDLNWIARNTPHVWELLEQHMLLSFLPVLVGLVLAVPLGVACVRWGWLYPLALAASSAFFAIPSLALFVFVLPYTGLSQVTAIVPLTLYTAALLLRNVVDGIRSTDESVRQAAAAMGYRGLHRLVAVELPIATPLILGGLRVAAVANISMVSVVSVIGVSSLGDLFIDGTQRFFATPILVGILLTAGLAAATDLALVGVQRGLTPWSRTRRTR